MNHNQQTSFAGRPDNYEALFVNGVIRVRDLAESGSSKTVLASANPTPYCRRFVESFLRSHSKAIPHICRRV